MCVVLEKDGLDEESFKQNARARAHQSEVQVEQGPKTFQDYYVRTNGVVVQRIRPAFRLPQVSVREAMFVWYIGGHYSDECLSDEEKKAMARIPHPPLNILRSTELHRADKYNFCKWRKVINAVVKAANLPDEAPSWPYIQKLFDAGKHCVTSEHEQYKYTIEQSSNTILNKKKQVARSFPCLPSSLPSPPLHEKSGRGEINSRFCIHFTDYGCNKVARFVLIHTY